MLVRRRRGRECEHFQRHLGLASRSLSSKTWPSTPSGRLGRHTSPHARLPLAFGVGAGLSLPAIFDALLSIMRRLSCRICPVSGGLCAPSDVGEFTWCTQIRSCLLVAAHTVREFEEASHQSRLIASLLLPPITIECRLGGHPSWCAEPARCPSDTCAPTCGILRHASLDVRASPSNFFRAVGRSWILRTLTRCCSTM